MLHLLSRGVHPEALRASAVALVISLGFGLIVPVLPLYASAFGASPAEVGLVVSVFALVRLVSDVPAGRFVDRHGTGRSVALGVTIVGVSSAAAGLAPSFGWLLALRGIGGIGSALFTAGQTGHLLARIPANQMGRAMGFYHSAFLVGATLGPAFGGLASSVMGLSGPFFAYAVACGIAAPVALRLLEGPPPAATAEARAQSPAPWRLGIDLTPTLLAALASTFAVWWMLGGFRFAIVPLYGKHALGLSEAAVGLTISVSSLANFLTLWPAGQAVDRLGRRALGVPAFLGLAVAAGAMLPANDLPSYLAANALFGLVFGVANVVPGALLADATPKGRAGSAAGLRSLAGDLGSVIGPIATGAALALGDYPAAIVVVGVPALLAAVAIAYARPGVAPGSRVRI